MAQRQKRKANRAVKSEEVALTIAPGYEREFPTFYANFANINHTNTEILADFCMIAPPHNVDIEKKQLSAAVVCRIVMPPVFIEALIKALRTQQEKQAETAKSQSLAIPIDATKKK